MNSEAKLKTLESQNICNQNKNNTLNKLGQIDESPSPIDLNKDDRVINLLNKQNSTQKNYNSRNRINSALLSQTNIKSQQDLNVQLKSYKQSRSKVNSNANQSSILESRKMYEEGYEKGLNENLAKYLCKNFNDLEMYLQPNQMNELRKTQNVQALSKTYSAVSSYRLIQSVLNLCILFIGSYFIDDLKQEWQEFWLVLSGMIGIQVAFFVIGMLANIYWRFESPQSDKKRCLKINQKCDLLFLIFYYIEFLFLSEFILLKDSIYQANYKYMLIELILRAAIISCSYAFILQKKKYFFLIFLTFIVYIPIRQSLEWYRYFTSNIQIIFSSLCLMMIVYTIRFQFKDSVDEAYKSTIFAYKDIISDLCLRLKQPQNQTQNSNLADIVSENNEKIPMPVTKKPQSEIFKPKKRKILNEAQKSTNQNIQNSKQLCSELFDLKESFLIDLIESISEGYCIIDENLNLLKMNNDMLKFFEADSFQECLNIIFYSGLISTNGEGEGQTQYQDKSKQLSQEHPQSQVFNFNQINNYDTVRKDSQQRRGTIIEIMDMDTSPMTNFHEKYNRLNAGQFFKIYHHFNNNSLEGNPNQNQINEFIDQSFQSKYYEQITPKQKQKDLKINATSQRQYLNQLNGISNETIILKEINAITSQLKAQKKSPLNSSKKGQGQAEILYSHQKNFYVKFTSVSNNQQSIYLFLRVTPIVKDSKIFFLIDATNKTLFQSYCNLEALYNRQQSIIRGFTEETYYSIHYLIQKLQESKQFCQTDFSKFHIDPLLSQAHILQNTLQILFEISNKKKPFQLNLQVENLIEFLQYEIIDIFNLEAKSKKILLKIETDNDVPSQVSTDFEKLKIILTIIIQNYMNFIQENQSIIISIKNQSLQSGDHDFSYGEDNQNLNQTKLNAFLLQFNVYLSFSSPLQGGEEQQRIQQIFTQSLKNSQEQADQNKSFMFGSPYCGFNQNYPNQNSPYQHINISRKSSFYKKKASMQQQIDEIFEQINNIQVCDIIAQKLVGPLFNQINLKSSTKLNNGLQFEKNEKGFPCLSFLIESQVVIHSYEKDISSKFTAHPADNSQNIFLRQTTDTYSPIYYSYRQPPRHKLEVNEREDDCQEGLIQIDLIPQKVQPTSLHNFPQTKSILHITQHESRKQSMISNINSLNEIYKAEEQGLLDVTNNNLNQQRNICKKITQNPKSLSGLPFDFNVATTVFSTHNQDDLDDTNQIGLKNNNRQTLKLENIPEVQVLEISKEVTVTQNDNDENISDQKKNEKKNKQAMKYLDKDGRKQADILNSQTSPQQKNIFQQSSKANKELFFQNKQMTFNKYSLQSSTSTNSPRLKKKTVEGGVDYNSYKDLPSSLSLYPNNQNLKLQYQDEVIINSKQNQNASGQDSIIFLQNQKNEKQLEINIASEKQVIQNPQNKQVLLNTVGDQFTGQQSHISLNKKIDQDFQKINRGFVLNNNNDHNQIKNLIVSGGNQGNGDQSALMYLNQPTPLFSATQHSKILPKLEIAQSVKYNQPLNLEKKQILFVDKHQLYHTMFQQVLSQYAKEQEDESFQSAYTVEECISLIENQYYQNKYQYQYIFIDNKMLNEGNNHLIDSIKQIFQQNKIQFESLIFICSNQYFDSSCFIRFGITSSLKKPITLKELEEKKIILQKKIQQNTTLSQSFSPIPLIKAQNEIFY
ncbi:transmembrane protein, putative (macronuclear) [Tetrahymena thermophila SB210]|uniref:Transmembrane protein, putative n=1 Tax=Tetrahymena thermophila (strain SB210) TaxID=312017 RepID=I7MM34_TETTS|nr:transmembrane protein, putative [Tetrahymena thermophila SB210]EAS03883.2 transmembrane protein, putative [Tetrahymena thermophila SB210]|eukprot:XP_001024128.2 transmembrane protein, putative [Tetrahymena thermophila SB210]